MFWLKTLLWLAVVLLPGGLLLLPVLYALHRREREGSDGSPAAKLEPVLVDDRAP
jgi:hypothetical protein